MVFAKAPAKFKLAMPKIIETADANQTLCMRNLVRRLRRE